MAATKRKLGEEEAKDVEVEKKSAALERLKEDRLSDLAEALQLRILACLDAKHAVQTSLLSKSWVNFWTRIPVLDLNYLSFNNARVFEPFVEWVMSRRDYLAKLDRLEFNCNNFYSPEALKNVFDYAFLHGVNQLEANMDIYFGDDYSWPLSGCDSLTNLKLQNLGHGTYIKCPDHLGSFKNLAILYLTRALITNVEPFSGFPVLESLTLLHCYFRTESKPVRLQSLRLSDLIISYCAFVNGWELRTTRLRFLEYGGSDFPKHEGLPILETLKIDFHGFVNRYYIGKEKEKRFNDDLMSFLHTIRNVKSVTISSAAVLLLSLFPDELVRRGSPFCELKNLTLDFSDEKCASRVYDNPRNYASVKAYLRGNSPHANVNIISSDDIEFSLAFFIASVRSGK